MSAILSAKQAKDPAFDSSMSIILARALGWHLEHRILCYSNKTVVFN